MKYIKSLLLISFTILSFNGISQIENHENHNHNRKTLIEKEALAKFDLKKFITDFGLIVNQKGYDYKSDACLKNFYIIKHSSLLYDIFQAYQDEKPSTVYADIYKKHIKEFSDYLKLFTRNEAVLRAEFKKRSESSNESSNTSGFKIPNQNSTQSACTNMDFETGNLTGWTTTTSGAGSSYVTTPGPDPLVAPINQVFAGNNSACIDALNSLGNRDWVQIQQTFLVTNSNKDFIFYTAVIIDRPGHTPCSDNAQFEVTARDASNNVIPCSNVLLLGADASGGACSVFNGFQTLGSYDYLNWTPIIVPLGNYVGQNVTISFRVTRCNGGGGHGARAYIEASCNPVALNASGSVICNGSTVNLSAPNTPGYSYQWAGPSGFTGSTSSVNPSLPGVYTVTMSVTSNPSCKMVMDTILTIAPSPTVNFNYTVTPCSATNSVPVVSTSTAVPGDPLSSYSWVWGDGTANGSGPSNNHAYATTGTQTIKLVIQSTNGCKDSIQKTFTFAPGPTASFNSTNACLNTPNSFSSTSTPSAGIASQVWIWGDGTANGSGTSPSHTYSSAGTYSVKLIVTASAGGCTVSVTQTVAVSTKPTITFTANPVCLNSATSFTNTSSITPPGSINSWAWDFDNNGTTDNTTQTPSNTYALAGTYNVELKATSIDGCSDSLVVPIVVNSNPTATFNAVNACVNANVSLNNTSSVPLPSTISSNWSFGAGSTPSTSSTQNPPSLTYNASGVKTITLTVTTNNNCSATITNTVNINPSPVANFSTTAVCQSTATIFTDMSNTTTGAINSWAWDYTNDGTTDNTTQNPSFTYPLSGNFTAALTVSATTGCTNTFTTSVNVWGHAIPNFSPSNVCFGTATLFSNNTNTTTNANVGTTPSYSWDFADGSGVQVLTGNPSHTYLGTNVNATYIVTLTATTSNNCIDTVSKTVHIYAIPSASFTSDSVCLGSPSHMLDASNGNGNTINGYVWDFLSNGTIDATGVSNPNFTFPAAGNNLVTYTASTSPVAGLTCQNITSTITVYVYPSPVPDFTFVNKCINAQPNTYDASISTIAVGTNTAYTWAFGDGSTSTSNITPTHTFVAAGIYNTTLTVTSDNGCQTSMVKQVEVYQKPIINIIASSACFNSSMTFTALSMAGSGTVNSWSWDFNNTIATFEGYGQFPSFVFPTAGSQTVHLVASTTNGCIDTFTSQPYVDYLPTPNFTVDKPSGCPLHCVKFTDNTPALTAPGVNSSWQWVFGDGATITSSSSASQNHCYDNTSYSQSALFDVKLIVTTNKGCKDSLNKPAFITVYPSPIAQYTVDPNPGSILSPIEQFTNQSLGFTKFWWCFGDGPISDSTNINPLHFYNDISAADYYSYLIVANQYGCRDTFNVKVEIAPEYIFYIPNAFTPGNEDNVNDYFTGMGVGIAEYEMWIFDRWGVNIFYSNDIHKGWDGKVQGKDAIVQQDVYTWKVKLKDVLGKKHDYVGHVTVLR